MTRKIATLISLTLALLATQLAAAAAPPETTVALALPAMVEVEGGTVELLFPVEGEEQTPCEPFRIDVYPVTNAEFREFVRATPEWARSNAPEVFAAPGYLKR